MTKSHIPQDHTDPFLTTREAALRLGVTLRSVQNYVERGDLHAGRTPGGHRRIRTSDVHALAEKMGIKTPEPVANQLQAAEIERLRLSLQLICADVERLDMALDPDDWAGDERMTDITARILARLDAIGVRSAGQEGGAA